MDSITHRGTKSGIHPTFELPFTNKASYFYLLISLQKSYHSL